ncbi:hypothetical protein ACIPPJ_31990 [Streptomyces sp. NPDC086091]|uniref:hypothetical protein n=1 Tax=Streptomyces sp. NPDC086091 TaxID=3365751 RepID=UPI003817A486
MQTFALPSSLSASTPLTLSLDLPAARVQLIAADRGDATVEVLPADAAKGRDAKAAEEVTVALVDGVLRIAAPAARNRVLGSSGAVEVTVQLPSGSRVEARTAAGALRGVGRLGDVTYETAQGTVKLDESGAARIALLDGDVVVGRLGGSAEISTQRGDITVTEAVRGTVTLTTQAGGISVGAAPGVSASLDAGTSFGRVHNRLRNSDGAAAPLAIRATTAYGDITARSL